MKEILFSYIDNQDGWEVDTFPLSACSPLQLHSENTAGGAGLTEPSAETTDQVSMGPGKDTGLAGK